MLGTVSAKRQMKTCPQHPNETVVFDTKIYTVVSEVSDASLFDDPVIGAIHKYTLRSRITGPPTYYYWENFSAPPPPLLLEPPRLLIFDY